jgi:MFS transporter, PAT family, beta-lactamase induction signal transducer AmpG
VTHPLRAPHLPLLAALYTAQGLPFGFFTLALPVLMREAGWSLTALGFLQFLAAPWVLKMLWAPIVDHHGQRRTWLLSMQLASCALAVAMALLGFTEGSIALFVAVFVFNLLAATQDVATDGLAVRLLNAQQRGVANGIQVGAYRFGMILGGGVLLWVFAHTNWQVAFFGMALMLALLTLPVWRMQEPPAHAPDVDAPDAHVTRPTGRHLALLWWHRAMRPGVLALAGLIFCFRFGDQMAAGLITPFLLDQGLTKADLAVLKGAVGSGTSLLGAAIGGWLMLRVGRRAALLGCGFMQAAVYGLYVAAALGLGGVPLLWLATVAEGVIGTMATVALYSLMMDSADPAHPGTDYTLMGSVGVSLATVGGIAGGLVGDHLGYASAFAAGAVVSVIGLIALVRWLDAHPFNLRVRQAW